MFGWQVGQFCKIRKHNFHRFLWTWSEDELMQTCTNQLCRWSHASLDNDDCTWDVLLLHSLTIGFDRLYPHLWLVREKDEHLVWKYNTYQASFSQTVRGWVSLPIRSGGAGAYLLDRRYEPPKQWDHSWLAFSRWNKMFLSNTAEKMFFVHIYVNRPERERTCNKFMLQNIYNIPGSVSKLTFELIQCLIQFILCHQIPTIVAQLERKEFTFFFLSDTSRGFPPSDTIPTGHHSQGSCCCIHRNLLPKWLLLLFHNQLETTRLFYLLSSGKRVEPAVSNLDFLVWEGWSKFRCLLGRVERVNSQLRQRIFFLFSFFSACHQQKRFVEMSAGCCKPHPPMWIQNKWICCEFISKRGFQIFIRPCFSKVSIQIDKHSSIVPKTNVDTPHLLTWPTREVCSDKAATPLPSIYRWPNHIDIYIDLTGQKVWWFGTGQHLPATFHTKTYHKGRLYQLWNNEPNHHKFHRWVWFLALLN